MFTDKTRKQAWSLYQAGLKHSTPLKDFFKLFEEIFEYIKARMFGTKTQLTEEFVDVQIMLLRDYCRERQPKSYEHFCCLIDYMSETFEWKHDRTLERFEKGFYK